jgi:CHAT domain-containing protein
LVSRQRDGQSAEDPFLPSGYVRAVEAIELSPTARALSATAELDARPGQVICIELTDGVTVFTSPEKLRETLQRVAPDAAAADALNLEGLSRRDAVTRGSATSAASVIARVTTLDVGGISDAILEAARRKLSEYLGKKLQDYAELGVSWLGTKALLWAVESQLAQPPGLYRWVAAQGEPSDLQAVDSQRLAQDAQKGPLLIFIHGTGSSTAGSYSELRHLSRDYWHGFETSFGDRVFAFEHCTMSESPIENALALVSRLPKNARVHLVTHSRGGLVGDLLCLTQLHGSDRKLIEDYDVDGVALGEVEGDERQELFAELKVAYAEHRVKLRELAAELADKQLTVERYVRVACPARGTRLASGNLDVFLSALLSLIGMVPALAGSPIYSAFKRVLLEIVKNRTKPNLVPGIEAMLPESPLARLLARATPQPAAKMAVIAGDSVGEGLFKRLGLLFTDHVFFDGVDNDLIVDTDSMYAGVAPRQNARALFDQGPDVSHFGYFTNDGTRIALRRWLVEANVEGIESFLPLPKPSAERPVRRELARGAESSPLPVVVVLPGVMGSHLWQNKKQRLWFDFTGLALGGFTQLGYEQKGVEAEQLFGMFYGDLCEYLAQSHRVEPFAYDWRLSLDVLADRLAQRLRALLDVKSAPGVTERPIRILAHSMGGLVVRALSHKHPALWAELMAKKGARLVMLGTPNQGSHAMVETLIGKSEVIRMLGRLDLKHDLQAVLNIVAGFRGALQLLPRTGFRDTANTRAGDYFDAALWQTLRAGVRDLWFGDGVVATPSAAALAEAGWLWQQPDELPAAFADQTYYVHGWARHTPCGLKQVAGRWKMLSTPLGDGTVTWDSGKLRGIPDAHYFWLPAEHGALADTPRYFESLAGLLARGEHGQLVTQAPAQRAAGVAALVEYEAGPPVYPTEIDLAAGLIGRKQPLVAVRTRDIPTLKVRVRAADLRFTTMPILVGHYERDAISGAEALIDRELVEGALSVRYDLGMYAGPLGTATVVLPARNELERARGSYRGAVVAGLGKYDGSLNYASLTEAVRTAALRYLLQRLDLGEGQLGQAQTGVPLASLLLGYDSSASLSVGDAVMALVRGVAEANRKFAEITRNTALYISELELVELYLDTAISATHALQKVQAVLNDDASLRCKIEVGPELHCGEGRRHRLEDRRSASHWSRAVITSEDAGDASSLRPGVPALAKRMRFLYLSQRARAETVLQQRQPGLVEKLVEQQLQITQYREDFSRALFQLLVPHEFKDAVRQIDRVVMVLDAYTANLPWELMLAEDRPLCVKAPMVRQLSSTTFRTQVKQSPQRRAYVVGNPSSEGFASAFSLTSALSSLPAAESEALTVCDVLSQHAYEVVQSIGVDQAALDVINRLYQGPYRLLHIAAHGVFEQLHGDGQTRSGVVLSDGLLITAVEIGSMEVVPDLVFLNCCHLGKVNTASGTSNRLAASVARELIEIGVRAVVVAGWAVDDDAANLFAETFYRGMLRDRKSFGEAVFEARQVVWGQFPRSITWGAYQAYGDPSFRLEQKGEDYAESQPAASIQFVASEELLACIEQARANLEREDGSASSLTLQRHAEQLEARLARAPQAFRERADVCAALGSFYGDLGSEFFDQAEAWLLKAIANGDKNGRASIGAIEQLANFESRSGEARADRDKVERALDRLLALTRLSAPTPSAAIDQATLHCNRAGLLGSAYKRLASICAGEYFGVTEQAERRRLAKAMDSALAQSARWYAAPTDSGRVKDPYTLLNWLFLMTLQPSGASNEAWIDAAHSCAAIANARYVEDPSFWDAIMAADAYLVESLLDGSLRTPTGAAQRSELLAQKYAAAVIGVIAKPRDLDSVSSQIALFSRFFRVHADQAPAPRDDGLALIAESLRQLSARLSPGAEELGAAATAAPSVFETPVPSAPMAQRPKRAAKSRRAAKTSARKKRS